MKRVDAYIPKYDWGWDASGKLFKGRSGNGVMVAMKGQELHGPWATTIREAELKLNAVEVIQVDQEITAETKAVKPVKPKSAK